MEALYHWIGLVVFWSVVPGIIVFGGGAIWQAYWFRPCRRRLANAWLGFKIIALRRPFICDRSGCGLIIQLSGKGEFWASDWWERNLAARIISDSRRAGFPTED